MLIEQGFDFRKAIYEVETCVDRSEFVSGLVHLTHNRHQTIARPMIPEIIVVYGIDFALSVHLQNSLGRCLQFLLMVRFDKGKANPLPIGSVVFVENGLS